MSEPSKFTNRLINEKSPYLLQHAHNPVNWYPWGEEAFQAAREQDKPIFLSIGYATCHWCHVMERESFENKEVADVINEYFIPIKVDREELPEVDALYMEFAQTMIIGSAGWPLTIMITPELKPFFAATYLPKESIHGLVGLIDIVTKIGNMWKSDEKERLIAQSEKLVDILKNKVHIQGTDIPNADIIPETASVLFKIADPVYGGMKGAPKFPLGYHANFLLRFYLKSQDTRALFLVEKTLEMMYRGGIYDHIGGGFARYSSDEKWLIPHFEKMLYDNAILSSAYLEAWRVTGRDVYKNVVEEVLNYLIRDMKGPEGGFCSAEDAESGGIEGLFYTWTKDEINLALGIENGEIIANFFGITDEGNFRDGRSVPHTEFTTEEFAPRVNLSKEELENIIKESKNKLFLIRKEKKRPLRDDKIITAWNDLAIHAFAEAGFYLQKQEYIDVAIETAEILRKNLFKDGVLYRRLREGESRFRGCLEDYTFLIQGLITLFEVGGGSNWLVFAIQLAGILERDFKAESGAFYQTDGIDTNLLFRRSQFSDGAEPSGNAVHAENLLRLFEITGNISYLEQAGDILKAAKRYIDTYPLGYCYHLKALQRYHDPKKVTVTISFNKDSDLKKEIIEILSHKMIPHYSTVFLKPGDIVAKELPFSSIEESPEKTTVQICYQGVCQAPCNEKEDILKTLKSF